MTTRKITIIGLAVTAFLALLLAAAVWAYSPQAPSLQTALPTVISYQGQLVDSSGNPVADGTYSVQFALYTVTTGGTAVWSETQSVTTTNGFFNVLLGSVTALDPADFDGRDLWLGVKVGTDPEMTPRQRMASVAYALRAQNANDADTVDGIHAGSFQRVYYDGYLAAGSSVTIDIPHYTLFTLQLSSGWPYGGGVAFVQGFENDWYVGVTYIKYNGDGTSGYGGAECDESSTDTLLQFGSGSFIYTVKCPGEASGAHNLVLTAAGVELKYRLIY